MASDPPVPAAATPSEPVVTTTMFTPAESAAWRVAVDRGLNITAADLRRMLEAAAPLAVPDLRHPIHADRRPNMSSAALAAFLRARLDEDEVAAKAAAGPDWFLGSSEDSDQRSIWYTGPSTLRPGDVAEYRVAGRVDEHDAEHIARHDPARVLREVEAKRAILRRFAELDADPARLTDPVKRMIWTVMRDYAVLPIAAVWSDHPDYGQEWAW